ncbi:MAG: alpha/beta hydrolase-fold protein [Bacteroidota bacterium]
MALRKKRGRDEILGIVQYHRGVRGEGLQYERDLIVWLPPSYERKKRKRYPVLYLHDGQNMFDPTTSFLGYDWQADETVDALIRTGRIEEIIMVGLSNTPDRLSEYSATELGRSYARFIVSLVKPFIDTMYRTKPDRGNTAVMGSSMGGLISLLMVWWYPEVFSQAGCISTALARDEDRQLFEEIESSSGGKKRLRIYLDVGGLERALIPGYRTMAALLRKKGYRRGKDLEYFFDRRGAHNERAWANRLWRPLTFMFGK